jgi:hypothetical protein
MTADLESGIQKLLFIMTDEIVKRGKTMVSQSKDWNLSMASFITRSFEFMDLSMVYEVIARHINCLNEAHKEFLLIFKFDFLKIILSTEHLLALDLPLSHYQQQQPLERITSMKEFWYVILIFGPSHT